MYFFKNKFIVFHVSDIFELKQWNFTKNQRAFNIFIKGYWPTKNISKGVHILFSITYYLINPADLAQL